MLPTLTAALSQWPQAPTSAASCTTPACCPRGMERISLPVCWAALISRMAEPASVIGRTEYSGVGSVPSATRMLYHVILARELLKIPTAIRGDVVECGVYKGASSASLSLVCALVGRKLWVCDSFSGLPDAERLTAVAVACLVIYDMVKAVERGVHIEGIHLVEKKGGKSGHYRA